MFSKFISFFKGYTVQHSPFYKEKTAQNNAFPDLQKKKIFLIMFK